MASLTERKAYREKIMQALYEATEGNRLLGSPGPSWRKISRSRQRIWLPPARTWWART